MGFLKRLQSLPNPGRVEELKKEAQGVLSPDVFDGAKFEFNNYVNVWAGRLLPPSDRANLSGPYYLNTWAFPVIAQRYPAIFAGRDNGVVGFGQVGGSRFKYAAGVFVFWAWVFLVQLGFGGRLSWWLCVHSCNAAPVILSV